MSAIYCFYVDFGALLPLAFLGGVLGVGVLCVILPHLVIRPCLHTEHINQLLVTGGVLFFLQGLATMLFSVEFRNLGVSFGSVEAGEMFFPVSRIIAFIVSLVAVDRKSTRLNSSHYCASRIPSFA